MFVAPLFLYKKKPEMFRLLKWGVDFPSGAGKPHFKR